MKAKVQPDFYNNASEVICESLGESLFRENENTWLVREAAIGYAQLDSCQTVPVDSKEQFFTLVRSEA